MFNLKFIKTMRNLLIIFVTMLGLVACDKELVDETSTIHVNNVNSENNNNLRDYNVALKIAERYVFGSVQTRSETHAVNNSFIYTPAIVTRGSDEMVPSFYIINFDDNKGYAVVSMDKRMTPVYAYSEHGNINKTDIEKDPGWKCFFSAATSYCKSELKLDTTKLRFKLDDPIEKYGDVAAAITEIYNGVECKILRSMTYDTIVPKLTTEWEQCRPYNMYFPEDKENGLEYDNKVATGCVPIALGQIMTYFRHPEKYNVHKYDWNAILSQSMYYWGDDFKEGCKQTAMLLRDIADASEINIEDIKDVVGLSFEHAKKIMNRFGYNYNVGGFSADIVWKSLFEDHPVFIRGGAANYAAGHAWVIDGGRSETITTKYYHAYPPYPIFDTTSSTVYYFHCNWGYGDIGSSDIYVLNVFESPDDITFNDNVLTMTFITPKK